MHSALGLLELGLARMEGAIRCLERARKLADRRGLAEPNVVHWQAELIEAYVQSGRPDAARGALATLERQAEHTRGRWALGVAARSRGLLADDAEAEA